MYIFDASATTRLGDMLERYGECCTQIKAAHILSKSARTIYRMLEDGRLRRVGSDVDVRSIVQYIDMPHDFDFATRTAKKRTPTRSRWDSFAAPVNRK